MDGCEVRVRFKNAGIPPTGFSFLTLRVFSLLSYLEVDGAVKFPEFAFLVIPAEAGIQYFQ